jgi:hypothetical protein
VLKNMATRHFEERSDEKYLFRRPFLKRDLIGAKCVQWGTGLASLEMIVPRGVLQHPVQSKTTCQPQARLAATGRL